MSHDILDQLFQAAASADALSVGNREIRLTIATDGFGILAEEHVMGRRHRSGLLLDWQQLRDGRVPLIRAVEDVDRALTESLSVEHTGNDAALSHPQRD